MPGGGLAQRAAPAEGQVAVGGVLVDRGARGLQRDARRPDIGVQVLQAQQVRVVGRVSRVTHLVHSDAGDVPEP